MLLSTFELLLKPITPTPGTVTSSDRSILQGYFLSIANPNPFRVRVRLRFNATTPAINISQVLTINDTLGTNTFSSLAATGIYEVSLAARDTGLVILQPDITKLDPANPADQVEVRGYVEIVVVRRFPAFPIISNVPLLLTPEHRGTFLPSPNGSGEFDQLICPLPTSSGGSLMNVETVAESPILVNPGLLEPRPAFPNGNGGNNGSTETEPQLDSIEQLLGFMAQRLDELSDQLSPVEAS
jgi:hypothetical protein